MKLKNTLRLSTVAVILALSPVVLFEDPGSLLSYRDASASVGTCCQDDNSLCIIPPYQIDNRYAMMPNVPCPPVVDPPFPDET